MKAIQTKITGPTNTRPRQIVAKAEGVKPFRLPLDALSYDDHEYPHRLVATNLAYRNGWLTPQHPRLIGGSLPDGTMAWVFAPAEEK